MHVHTTVFHLYIIIVTWLSLLTGWEYYKCPWYATQCCNLGDFPWQRDCSTHGGGPSQLYVLEGEDQFYIWLFYQCFSHLKWLILGDCKPWIKGILDDLVSYFSLLILDPGLTTNPGCCQLNHCTFLNHGLTYCLHVCSVNNQDWINTACDQFK